MPYYKSNIFRLPWKRSMANIRKAFCNKKGGYNKFQRKAYKRKAKAYKNRQQLLSIKTVKAIAKKAAESVPEVKFYQNENYLTQNQVIQDPADGSGHYLAIQLIEPGFIPVGVGQSQRVGDSIRLKGIHIKVRLHNPVKQNVKYDDAHYRAGQFHRCHVKVVKVKMSGEANTPPKGDDQIANTPWVYQGVLNKSTNDYNLLTKTPYKKVYNIRSKLMNELTTVGSGTTTGNLTATSSYSDVEVAVQNGFNVPRTILINKYIPLDDKITFTGTSAQSMKNTYFLWIYSFALNQLFTAGTYWGNDIDYALRADFSWVVYYTDS